MMAIAFESGGHRDSLIDIHVYAAIQIDLDEKYKGEDNEYRR